MRNLTALFFILIFSCAVFAQTDKEKSVSISPKALKERIIKQEFPDVPEEIRRYHAKGVLNLRVSVDEDGNVKKVNIITEFTNKTLSDYLQKTIFDWKFKPFEKNGKRVSVTGILQIPFCYGSFSDWCFNKNQ